MRHDTNDPRETCLALGTYTEHRPHRVSGRDGDVVRPTVHRRFHCTRPLGHVGPHHDHLERVQWTGGEETHGGPDGQ